MDGAGGVDQALQAREPEAVVQAPQLEGGQGGQASLICLLVGGGAIVPETHHTWNPHTEYVRASEAEVGILFIARIDASSF